MSNRRRGDNKERYSRGNERGRYWKEKEARICSQVYLIMSFKQVKVRGREGKVREYFRVFIASCLNELIKWGEIKGEEERRGMRSRGEEWEREKRKIRGVEWKRKEREVKKWDTKMSREKKWRDMEEKGVVVERNSDRC